MTMAAQSSMISVGCVVPAPLKPELLLDCSSGC
jgi:hypothetical protein